MVTVHRAISSSLNPMYDQLFKTGILAFFRKNGAISLTVDCGDIGNKPRGCTKELASTVTDEQFRDSGGS
jgi:hypothetical protein